jgi:hypothetical protein
LFLLPTKISASFFELLKDACALRMVNQVVVSVSKLQGRSFNW